MAFSNDEKQEIKDIVLETMTEQSDAVDYTEQVVEFAPGDEVPIVRNNDGTGEKSYGRAPVSMFGGGGSSGVNGIKVGGSGQVLTPTSGVVTLPAYESGAEKNPVKYLKEAAISQDGNSLTIKDNNNETKTFTPSGGGGGTGTVTGIKVGESGTTINPDGNGVVQIPSYEAGAEKHKAPTSQEVKNALGTGSGTTKYLREDGQWAEPQGGGGGGNTADVNYDTTNKKITKTIDGVTSDVVTVATLKTDMSLENVGNFKAVSTVANQGLSDTEKSNARTNIGAGTSSFSGSYNDLTNKPTIPCADKSYAPLAHSGLGRKNLEPKNGSNVLTQQDFNSQNTIYVIRYDFDLDGEEIDILAGCVLLFDGGSINNGTLVLDNTLLEGNPIFDCNLSGTARNATLCVDIMKHSDGQSIQQVFNLGVSHIVFSSKEYSFSDVNIVGDETYIEGNGTTIVPVKITDADETRVNFLMNVFHAEDKKYVRISGISFVSDIKTPSYKAEGKQHLNSGITAYSYPLIDLIDIEDVKITDCKFKNIEGCTGNNPNRRLGYGYKQGLVINLWDVTRTTIENIEATNCRFDEQIWCHPHLSKGVEDVNMVFRNNYFHDMEPLLDSSILSVQCNSLIFEGNIVNNWEYHGSIFNLHGLDTTIKDNKITNAISSSVFDTSEYGDHWCDKVVATGNNVTCLNGIFLVAMANNIFIKNNVHKGKMFAYCDSKYNQLGNTTFVGFADKVRPTNTLVCVSDNYIDGTYFDSSYSYTGSLNQIYVRGYNWPCGKVIIEGNTVVGFESYSSYGLDGACTYIALYNCKFASVARNSFDVSQLCIGSSVVRTNIMFYRLTIDTKNNQVYGNAVSDDNPYFDSSVNNIDKVIIMDNKINNTGTYAIAQFYTNPSAPTVRVENLCIENNTSNNEPDEGLYHTPYMLNTYIANITCGDPVTIMHYLFGRIDFKSKSCHSNFDVKKVGNFAQEYWDGVYVRHSDVIAMYNKEITVVDSASATETSVAVVSGDQVKVTWVDTSNVFINSYVIKVVNVQASPSSLYSTMLPRNPNTLVKDAITKVQKSGVGNLSIVRLSAYHNRPTFSIQEKEGVEGLCIYDKILKMPIWWDGNFWKDVNGVPAYIYDTKVAGPFTLVYQDVQGEYNRYLINSNNGDIGTLTSALQFGNVYAFRCERAHRIIVNQRLSTSPYSLLGFDSYYTNTDDYVLGLLKKSTAETIITVEVYTTIGQNETPPTLYVYSCKEPQ